MNIVLWALQIILAIKLLDVSYKHGLRHSMPTMQSAIQKLGKAAPAVLYMDAVIAFFGALGLILPGLLRADSKIIAATAALMALMLLVSIIFHMKSREKPKIFVSLVLFVFAAAVAYSRWVSL
jgi:hypothetical protein